MSGLAVFTLAHVAVSLLGIVSGAVVLVGLLSARKLDGWTTTFLASTAITSISGFGFPVDRLLPSHIVGALSLIVLAAAYVARHRFQFAGRWRIIYVLSAVTAFYFNVFVLVVQLFQKVPALKVLAPTQSEPPFALTQLAVLIAFVGLGIRAAMKFRPTSAAGPFPGAKRPSFGS